MHIFVDGSPSLSDWLSLQSLSSLLLFSQSQDGRFRLYIRATPCAVHLCARLAFLVSLASLLHAAFSLAACVSLRPLHASRLCCCCGRTFFFSSSATAFFSAAPLASRLFSPCVSPLFSLLVSAAAHSTSCAVRLASRLSCASRVSSRSTTLFIMNLLLINTVRVFINNLTQFSAVYNAFNQAIMIMCQMY